MTKINKGQIITDIEKTQLKTDIPVFGSGDTVEVWTNITEGAKTRTQKFEGVVMRRKGKGLSETFLVRKESSGVWVEESFLIHSPLIESIIVKRRGKVRRAYISYMRKRSGKSARIKELKTNIK